MSYWRIISWGGSLLAIIVIAAAYFIQQDSGSRGRPSVSQSPSSASSPATTVNRPRFNPN